ncbi:MULTISPECIES: phosphatidylserine/phosphatidylglycerophosphate/cardiolipin synthase family protein [unclassified Mesorhizobium]|uniref:phospholipase D-like domain-containing protein n=1 Tax=unclassified Mesorhizobium TaxID=325217 RepID=UPI001126C1A3|nr:MULTISPECIES: phosphatidylserine/phosphatidylglycerophosphate/cardiolipin synthase family protein [unclassified Mesorhizobium]MCA0026643.1 phosphatidylserine/phosphatidylglycerophosphate/cardiolipin synthase family protein [Mesorhizobium sp. B263B1A]TPJ90160.1 phosphatidylserine/phosphatidylglycerophosphate/cardiolipin synthase family protein [Mesorhizobium sp. B2-5-12]TPK21779.1 phosphatidylserine/phosphatidylglycerophosphate/cardiolipin synthase family protein [Mesorhizobium sp. B2-5-6]
MLQSLATHWPQILAIISVVIASVGIAHAVMTKEDVRAATGWVGVMVLSPILGVLIYAVAGINRIRRASISAQRSLAGDLASARHDRDTAAEEALIIERYGPRFIGLRTLGDRVARRALHPGNAITVLETGDEAYTAMCAAIDGAERSVLLETYIFDNDPVGLLFVESLARAVRRGVSVRVLIDAVGARYSVPSILGHLRGADITAGLFNGNIVMGLHLPYANLRTHRKILVVDGTVAFTGGMNIRKGFSAEFAGSNSSRDTHFRVTGPVVADLFSVAAEDWRFASNEALKGDAWRIAPLLPAPATPMLVRAVASGPDASVETNHKLLIGAFSVARKSIRLMSPYFLPDRELISALTTAARRGVEIDIVVPAVNNLFLVDRAMTAQFDQVLKHYCRVWRTEGPFDHSKLLSIDGAWAYVGSSNLDARSLRLNFEIDLEVLDAGFASEIEKRIVAAIDTAVPVTLEALRARPFVIRLFDRILWLGSPYL